MSLCEEPFWVLDEGDRNLFIHNPNYQTAAAGLMAEPQIVLSCFQPEEQTFIQRKFHFKVKLKPSFMLGSHSCLRPLAS